MGSAAGPDAVRSRPGRGGAGRPLGRRRRARQAREELAALRLCVDALPPDLARLVSLRYVEGLATRAIAETERMPEATVRLRLDEARAALERCLKSKGVW